MTQKIDFPKTAEAVKEKYDALLQAVWTAFRECNIGGKWLESVILAANLSNMVKLAAETVFVRPSKPTPTLEETEALVWQQCGRIFPDVQAWVDRGCPATVPPEYVKDTN
ncbi:MAG: hypothetical protein LBH14_00375 [Desulfobulbaceae bacterium]|jgi:hypothetical protein|nr:hypothetical protein [Desulfobulbaceae bacterium]